MLRRGSRGSIRDDGRIRRVVQRGPDVVAHATVHGHERADAGDPLRSHDAVQRDPGPADERAPGFEIERRLRERVIGPDGLADRGGVRGEIEHGIAGAERDREAAADADLLHRHAGRPLDLAREVGERRAELAIALGFVQLRPEMRMDPDEPKSLRRDDRAALRERVAAGDRRAELAVEDPGAQVRMRVGADAGRYAEPHRLRRRPPGDQPGQSIDLVRAVDHDPADAQAERRTELVIRLGVAVELGARHREASAPYGQELAERRRARVRARSREDRRDAAKPARLDRIGDPDRTMGLERRAVAAIRVADRRGVVHVQRRPEAIGEAHHIDPADAQVRLAVGARVERPDRWIDHRRDRPSGRISCCPSSGRRADRPCPWPARPEGSR